MGKKIFWWVLGAIIIYCWGHFVGYGKGERDVKNGVTFMQKMGGWQE